MSLLYVQLIRTLEAMLLTPVAWFCLPVVKCGMGSRTDSGCCNSCCKRSFDDDDFDKETQRPHKRERAAAGACDEGGNKGVDDESVLKENGGGVVNAQPAPAQAMEQPRRSSEGAVQ